MKGGLLIGNGNNTCVYNPPVDCTDDSPIPPNHVSRIVHPDSVEPDIQTQIKAALAHMDPKYLKHFNLATKICRAKFKPEDLAEPCSVEALQHLVKSGPTNLINILTPIQDSDINRKTDGKFYKSPRVTKAGFKNFLHALVEMNSYSVQVFHTDAHIGNVSWKGPDIVLHDWEKCHVGDENLLANINGSKPTSWNLLGFRPEVGERAYLMEYPCWKIPLVAMGIFDMYQRRHDTLQLTHEIYFRFWDLFSIATPLRQMYIIANTPEPPFAIRIMKESMDYFFDKFMDAYSEYPRPVLSAQAKKARLDEITNHIHEIIDAAFQAENNNERNNKQAANAELLKLVAKHASNSPSKAVLLNMLPKAPNGGRRKTRRSKK